MGRALWFLVLLGASPAFAQSPNMPTAPMPPMPPGFNGSGGPPGFPDVSGGRVAIISMKDMQGKAGGLPIVEPTFGEKFKEGAPDRIIVKPNGLIAPLDDYRSGAKPAADILPNSTIKLLPLEGTLFEKMTLLGYLPAGGLPQGPWTAVQRLFAKPPGELVLLKEADFGLDGTGIVMFDEMLNTKVGGERAIFVVTKRGGTTQTAITWVTGSRQVQLIAVCKLRTGCTEAEEWRNIASSLPTAPVSKPSDK